MKIVPYLIVFVILGGLVLGYFSQGFKLFDLYPAAPTLGPSAKIMPEETTMQAIVSADIPPDWKLYSSANGFKLYYPSDMENDNMAEGERFYRLGPTQSRGTELYDGISMLIRSGDMADLTIQKLAEQKHQEMKNQETTREITNPISKTYGKHQAIQFRQSSMGDGNFIYIQMPGKKYLEIIDMTVEPKNREQTYQKIVEQMVISISF